MTEPELSNSLKKAQKGSRDAFGDIYEHYKEKLYRFIYFRVGHKELAEDILSDTFVKAWQKVADINSPNALTVWIYQVAKNNVIDYYRLKRPATIAVEEVVDLPADDVSPVDSANISVEQRLLVELMERIPDEQKQVIKYKFFEGMTNQEIASVMDKSEGAIRVIQHRAINKLKQLLGKKNL